MLPTFLKSISLFGHSRLSIICLNSTLQIYFPIITYRHIRRLQAGCLNCHLLVLFTSSSQKVAYPNLTKMCQELIGCPSASSLTVKILPSLSHSVGDPSLSILPATILLALIAAVSSFDGPERLFKIIIKSNIGLPSFSSSKIKT